MLGTSRLLTFSFRVLVLVLLLPLLWLGVAERYNEALTAAAETLLPAEFSLRVVGSHIIFSHPTHALISIEGFTLHYGLILLSALILGAVGIGMAQRIGWLLGLGVGTYLLHVVGVAMLARGVVWASTDSAERSGDRVFSAFAVFWGLIPPIIGGAWAVWYWLLRAGDVSPPDNRNRAQANEARVVSGAVSVGDQTE